MENLVIEKTKNSPAVNLNEDGNLLIEGRIILEDTLTFFQPILSWMDDLKTSNIQFDIKLDYLNTSASKLLFSILDKLDNNNSIYDIQVNWYYEEDDEDHYDTGQYFEESLERSKFRYLAFSDLEMVC